jgi:hypothetical protein
MEALLPIAIIVLSLVFKAFPSWVEPVVLYLALYVPWKMMTIHKAVLEVRRPQEKASSTLEKLRSHVRNGRKK